MPVLMSKNELSELLQRARREKQAGSATAPPTASVFEFSDKFIACDAKHVIGDDCVYVPDFLDAHSASSFAAHIEASAVSWGGWQRMHRRDLLNLGGVPHPSGTIAEHLPPTLQSLSRRVHAARALPIAADQCLLNRQACKLRST